MQHLLSYDNSYLSAAIKALLSDFAAAEKNALSPATLTGASLSSTDEALTGQKLFAMSKDEAERIPLGDALRKARYIYEPTGEDGGWWLRTFNKSIFLIYNSENYHYSITNRGMPDNDEDTRSLGVRPACYLDPRQIVLFSAAVGGKAGEIGVLEVNAPPAGAAERKLTLLDAQGSSLRLTTEDWTEAGITLAYTGASWGTKCYLSAVIVADDGSVSHYGRLKPIAQKKDASGVLTLSVPPGVSLGSNATLKLFWEKIGDDYETDSAGTPIELPWPDIILYPETLPAPATYEAYTAILRAEADRIPVTSGLRYELISGELPPGLTLVTGTDGTATLSGTPTQQGSYTFTVRTTHDATSMTGQRTYTLTVGKGTPIVTGVTVTPDTVSVPKGSTYDFSATVNGYNDPDQSVFWWVSDPGGVGTKIDDQGYLEIGANENRTTLIIDAISLADKSKYGRANVTVTALLLNAVNITPKTAKVSKGETKQFYVQDDNGNYQRKEECTWTITGNTSANTTVSNGLVTIGSDENAGALTLTAASIAEPDKRDTATITVTGGSPSYAVIFGANASWYKGSGDDMTLGSNGQVSKLKGVTIDGVSLNRDQFRFWSGSTYVALRSAYLETLALGEHTIRILFDDGYAETRFTVQNAAPPPVTGDGASPVLWLALLLAACLCLGYGRRRLKSGRAR